MSVDYKQKYIDLRSKFAKTCDAYYRTGYEEGIKEGQQQAQQEQMMMQQQQEMMAQGIDPETGQPIEGASVDENGMSVDDQGAVNEAQTPMDEEMGEAEGSELDNHINELESLVQKGEKPKVTDLRKAVKALANLRKSQKARMAPNHKKVVVSKQKELVNNILKKWETEANSKSVTENLENIIASEGIKLD